MFLVQGFAKLRADKVESASKKTEAHDAVLTDLKVAFATMGGELKALREMLSNYMQGVSELKGRVDDAVQQQAAHISTIGHLSRQIDALFNIVEAGKRLSDQAKDALGCKKG